jgi:hypothetical protein
VPVSLSKWWAVEGLASCIKAFHASRSLSESHELTADVGTQVISSVARVQSLQCLFLPEDLGKDMVSCGLAERQRCWAVLS